MPGSQGSIHHFQSAVHTFWQEKKNRILIALTTVFLAAYFIPFEKGRVESALHEAFLMLGEYAREHVLLCLVPAFFIAGAVMVFLNQQAVIRYLGPSAPKPLAYGVASVSGTILAVCSCTVLPLFKGIYRKGAGIGPAVAFLYSGPAINILAIVLTAKVLGPQLGLARAAGAILFSILIGLSMQLIYRREDSERVTNEAMFSYDSQAEERSLGQNIIYMTSMIGILVFVNWAPSGGSLALWDFIYRYRYLITVVFAVLLLYTLFQWFSRHELQEWVTSTRDFAVQILPLLFGGVLIAGFLLGRPGQPALIPEQWIASLVGGNSLAANAAASIAGALMYFATLTEVPIMQGLLGAGMGNGPALALLLAGPSLSLPNLLVIGGELGARKTLTYVGLVVLFSTFVGMLYGYIL
jgi:uncharacterized membrane protein YraQ (UPF0718 family)